MKERPILFSSPMIRALLAGTKTQTRRAVRSQPPTECSRIAVGSYHPTIIRRGEEEPGHETFGAWTADGEWAVRCPYGQPGGSRLWVRETWAAPHAYDHLPPRLIPQDARFHYGATAERGGLRWRPSIHMCRWASRITLEITGVRVERLQDISDEGAFAEGVQQCANEGLQSDGTARGTFRSLWELINGPGYWDANPFVWVIEFHRMRSEQEGTKE